MIKHTELRKLPADYLSSVEEILETNEDWKTLMNIIPRNLENLLKENYERKYNCEHIRIIEKHAHDTKVKCAKVLFGEWGTSGRVRPTLDTLQTLLVKAYMFKAADVIAVMLGEPLPPRPVDGPPAPIVFDITKLVNEESVTQELKTITDDQCNRTTKQMKSHNLMVFSSAKVTLGLQDSASDMIEFSKNTVDSQYLPDSAILNPKININLTPTPMPPTRDTETQSNSNSESTPSQYTSQNSNFYEPIDSDILEDNFLILFSYNGLEDITNNFTTILGSGGFGDVFLGNHDGLGLLAVKKANVQFSKQSLYMVTKMFNNEVKSLSLLRHENIVPILGYSLDGPAPCIVCEYIDGGTLKQKVADGVLNESDRINIMVGTAEGLKYIHNSVKPSPDPVPSKACFIHGDVKSANILLTKNCIPKLCDFGLSKQFDPAFVTDNLGGTSAYMAPESFYEIVTQKSDVYSFGIVLLELLTGLEPIANENNEIIKLKDYLQENSLDSDVNKLLLDNVIDKWFKAQSIYGIAKLCLIAEHTHRPSMDEICRELHIIQNNN